MARAGKLHMSFDFNSNMTECIEYHISVRYPIFLISDAYAIYASFESHSRKDSRYYIWLKLLFNPKQLINVTYPV